MNQGNVPIIGESNPQEEMQRRMQQAKEVLDAVNKQRATGLTELKDRVANLSDNENLTVDKVGNAATVDALRSLVRTVEAVFKTVDAQNKIVDMVISDLSGTVNGMRQMQQMVFGLGESAEVVVHALLKNGLLTEQQLQEAYQAVNKEFSEAVQSQIAKP